MKSIINKILKNQSVGYLITKYGVFIITFINSLLIASKLGPQNLGIYGFINLIINYSAYANLGIPNSLNVLISRKKQNLEYVKNVFYNSNSMILLILFIIIILYIVYKIFFNDFGSKFNFSSYSFIVLLIILLNVLNSNIIILLRVFNKINLLSITQILSPILVSISLVLFEEEQLIEVLLFIMLLTAIVSFLYYNFYSPFSFKLKLNKSIINQLKTKGLFLFIYNCAFYCIMLSTKSLISQSYEVKEFGYFTFSFSFANAVLLLLNTISFLIFPKMIAKLSDKDNYNVNKFLRKIRTGYIFSSHILIHLAILLFPLFLDYFPNYTNSLKSFQLIGLTLIMYNNAYGYQGLLIARDQEKVLSILAVSALVLNLILVSSLTIYFGVDYSYVIIGTMVIYFIYTFILTYLGRKSLGLQINLSKLFKDAFNLKIMIPYFISFCLIIINAGFYHFFIPLILLIILNWKTIIELNGLIWNFVLNPKALNI